MVSNHPVGVDIETIRPFKESLARYVMSDDELQVINGSDLEFTKLWTRKEAVVKRSGHGISNDMKHVLVGLPFEIETVVNIEKDYVYSVIL